MRRQHHGPKVPLLIRIPPATRGQIVGLAEADRRSLNGFANVIVELGLEVWLQRAKRAQDPARARATEPTERSAAELRALVREVERDYQAAKKRVQPELPKDLTDEERAMLGLPPEEDEAEEPLA